MKLVKFLALFYLPFCIVKVYGQNYVDLFSSNYTSSPTAEFDSVGGESYVGDFETSLTLPVKLENGDAIITGVSYDRVSTVLFPYSESTTFSGVSLKAGLSKKFSDSLSLMAVLLPRVAGDFDGLVSENYQLGALALLKWKKNDQLKYKAGLYYNADVFGAFFVPLFGFYYQSLNEKFEANITLPVSIDVNYKLNNIIASGLNFGASTRGYHLNDKEVSDNGAYVVKASNELYYYLQFSFAENYILQTRVGYSLGRSYRLYESGDRISAAIAPVKFGDDREQLNVDFEDSFLAQLKFIYRFHL